MVRTTKTLGPSRFADFASFGSKYVFAILLGRPPENAYHTWNCLILLIQKEYQKKDERAVVKSFQTPTEARVHNW